MPIQQAQSIVAKLKDAGVVAELVVRQGAVHGWKDMKSDVSLFADWFDKHLPKRERLVRPAELLPLPIGGPDMGIDPMRRRINVLHDFAAEPIMGHCDMAFREFLRPSRLLPNTKELQRGGGSSRHLKWG